MLREAADAENLKLITEVMDLSQIEVIDKYTHIFQVGAWKCRTSAAAQLGHAHKPVLIKRGISATIGNGCRRPNTCRAAEQRRHPVRARHPHLRDRGAQHLRHPRSRWSRS
jgi:hypothetical protein